MSLHEWSPESESRCSGRISGSGEVRINPDSPVKELKCKEGGHLHEVGSSSGVQLALETRVPASSPWSLGMDHAGSILS